MTLHEATVEAIESNGNKACSQLNLLHILCTIANAPWFTCNREIHDYLNMPTIKQNLRSTLDTISYA